MTGFRPAAFSEIVRLKTEAQFLRVLPLLWSLGAESSGGKLSLAHKKAFLQSWKNAKRFGYRLYAARKMDRFVGVMGLTEIYDPLDRDKSFRINNLVVAEELRGRGIGTAMLRYAETVAREECAAHLILEVMPTNKKALRLYEKTLGYSFACNRMLKTIKEIN